ncbi:hypothetical protein CK203_045885 [Vitis vinifera]|uniref:Uncharacterized protein n=1 Tax=Vitis vinifera TaxID=29760 RepID=A0A438I4Y6_VITVI|nr:hypothetical protein CK203_045885 [Vitis vinifera]
MQRRHGQGLCFNCNDKFTAAHRCQGPQNLVLEGCTKTNEIMCEEVVNENSIENQHADLIELEISLHALTGWSIPCTMGIKAQIGYHELELFQRHRLSFEWLMVVVSSVKEGLDLVLRVQWLEQLGSSFDKVARPKMHSDMQKALEAYTDIFKEPTQLPLVREVDHCIPLKDGIEPINVSPYSKCVFGQHELEYLGHIVTNQGVKVDQGKIEVMIN